FLQEVVERRGSGGAFARQLLHNGIVPVVHHALVAAAQQATHHVGAHSSQADHSQLHGLISGQRMACVTASASVCRPRFTSAPRCARNARRLRSASTSKSPRACAAFTTPKVYFWPGTGRSFASSQVIWRNTPVFGPPL